MQRFWGALLYILNCKLFGSFQHFFFHPFLYTEWLSVCLLSLESLLHVSRPQGPRLFASISPAVISWPSYTSGKPPKSPDPLFSYLNLRTCYIFRDHYNDTVFSPYSNLLGIPKWRYSDIFGITDIHLISNPHLKVFIFCFHYMFLANQRLISSNFLLCRPSQRSARSQVTSQVATHQKIGSQL